LCHLSFSGTKCAESTKQIFKALEKDTNIKPKFKIPENEFGFLQQWADQKVLLLNTSLTVRETIKNNDGTGPGSHKYKGWEDIVSNIIRFIHNNLEHKHVFMMWGADARNLVDSALAMKMNAEYTKLKKEKKSFIRKVKRSTFLSADHPTAHISSLLTSSHFSKCNEHLDDNSKINWQIDEIQN